MKKIRISIVFFIVFSLIIDRVYAIYHYSYILNAFELSRDDSPITYSILRNNEEGYTNQDVDLILSFNKKVDDIDGYEKLSDGKSYKKTFSENEIIDYNITDISGNHCKVHYSIDNIDKVMPTIDNIEDGGVYTGPILPAYKDNIGIASVDIKRYKDMLVDLFPDYVDSSDYRGIDILDKSISVRVIRKSKRNSKIQLLS